MAENKRDFVKINEEDLQYAEQFFDNEKHFNEWLVNVFNYYRGKEVKIKTKIVQKYFDNYKKTMNIVMVLSQKGKETYKKRVENKQVTEDTLEAYLEPTCEGTSNLPETTLPVNSKYINSKEVNNKNKVLIDLSFVDFDYLNSFELWLEYKKTKNQKYKTQKSLELCYKNLLTISNNDPDVARKIIENSIANNYSGLFPLKQNNIQPVGKAQNYIQLYNQIQDDYANKPTTGKKFGEL